MNDAHTSLRDDAISTAIQDDILRLTSGQRYGPRNRIRSSSVRCGRAQAHIPKVRAYSLHHAQKGSSCRYAPIRVSAVSSCRVCRGGGAIDVLRLEGLIRMAVACHANQLAHPASACMIALAVQNKVDGFCRL